MKSKRIISGITAFLIACGNAVAQSPTVFPIFSSCVTASAEYYGDYVYMQIDDNSVEIIQYLGDDYEINIPLEIDGMTVTGIGENAFKGCYYIVKVVIPDTVTEIKAGVFANCPNLEQVVVSPELFKISDRAFANCTNLSSLIPSDEDAELFENTVYFPDKMVAIGTEGFSGCESLHFLKFSDDSACCILGSGAFMGCSSLIGDESGVLEIPVGVREIQANTFRKCDSLEKVVCNGDVTCIGKSAFKDCVHLKEIRMNDCIEQIDSAAFSGCFDLECMPITTDGMLSFTRLDKIANRSFAYCRSLDDIYITANIGEIESEAFNGCTSLENINFEKGSKLDTIGESAFLDCISLKSVEIPDSVNNIMKYAFGYSDKNNHIDGFEIKGYRGSAAQEYAKNNALRFLDLDPVKGDVNCDGVIDYKDRGSFYDMLDGKLGRTSAADLNNDGKINIQDRKKMESLFDNLYIGDLNYDGDIDIKDRKLFYDVLDGKEDLLTAVDVNLNSTLGDDEDKKIMEGLLDDRYIGDLNFDGKVDSIDLEIFINAKEGWNYLSAAMDVNFDGSVDNEDYAVIEAIVKANDPDSNGGDDPDIHEDNPDTSEGNKDVIINEGTCGEGCTWKLDDKGTLTISGNGKLEELVTKNGDVLSDSIYNLNFENLVIEEGITEIGEELVIIANAANSVTFPKSLTKISELNYLKKVICSPESAAFKYFCDPNKSLSELELVTDDGKKYKTNGLCGDDAYWYMDDEGTMYVHGKGEAEDPHTNENPKKIVISEGITEIADSAFCGNNNSKLKEVVLSNTLTKVGEMAFGWNKKLKEVTIPSNVKEIGELAFGWTGTMRTSIGGDGGGAEMVEGFTIKGVKGSAAEKYAKEYGLKFVEINENSKPHGKGDVNGDGYINITDISKVAAHVKGKKMLSGDALNRADVNGDGNVNVTDISKIAAHVKGKKSLIQNA